MRLWLSARSFDTRVYCESEIRSDRPYALIGLGRFLVKLVQSVEENRSGMDRARFEHRQGGICDFLDKVACGRRQDPQSVDLAHEDGGGEVVVSAVNARLMDIRQTHLKHSPLGPTTSTRPAHDNTKALSPHHSTTSGMPTSPKLPISTSLSDLEKSEETTQSDPVAVVRAIKRVLGDVTMFVKGPLEIR